MLKGQKKGQSKYPMRLICEKCGKFYIIRRYRVSKLCRYCASTVPTEYIERKGEYYERWLKSMKRFIDGELSKSEGRRLKEDEGEG